MSSGKRKKNKKTKQIDLKKIEKEITDEHYINNKEFLTEMVKWKKEIREAEDSG